MPYVFFMKCEHTCKKSALCFLFLTSGDLLVTFCDHSWPIKYYDQRIQIYISNIISSSHLCICQKSGYWVLSVMYNHGLFYCNELPLIIQKLTSGDHYQPQRTMSCSSKDLRGKYKMFTKYGICKGIYPNFI